MPFFHTPPLSPVCVSCLIKKQIDRYPADAPREAVLEYLRRLGAMMADLPDRSSGPMIMEAITRLRAEVFGAEAMASEEDYTAVKHHFNRFMTDFAAAEHLADRIRTAADPLRAALGYAMIGNFIDFGAMGSVDEERLRALLSEADRRIDPEMPAYRDLSRALGAARSLVLLTDNCGEIVLDKLLIGYLREAYPALSVTVLVRGAPVLNDATMEDAVEVGLAALPGVRVMDNGDSLAGTALGRISPEAETTIREADLILSKGQGNYETLRGCGLPVYYAFLCKCAFFADRFGVPLYSGMLVREGADPTI